MNPHLLALGSDKDDDTKNVGPEKKKKANVLQEFGVVGRSTELRKPKGLGARTTLLSVASYKQG